MYNEPIDVIKYTENQFMNKLNEELDNSRKIPYTIFNMDDINDSNSPISMSDSEDDDQDEHINYDSITVKVIDKSPLKKLTFREVQSSIDKYYNINERSSNELDILSVYLNGQKHLYLKASNIMTFKTYLTLIPCSISGIVVIIYWNFIDIFSLHLTLLNGFIFFLYFLNVFFQWNVYTVLYKQHASHFEKIINNSFINIDIEHAVDVLQKTEETLRGLDKYSLPWECNYMFPLLTRINLFTFIKRIEIYKKNLIMKFKDIKNEIKYIQWKFGDNMCSKEKYRLLFLCNIKEKIKNEILQYKNSYGELENLIIKEIHLSKHSFCIPNRKYTSENPVIISYFSTIFVDD
jgi:hypothetical protein